MKRAVVLLGVVALAGCGGTHTTEPANTGSRNVTKPLARPIVVKLQDGSARLRPVGSKATAVSIQLAKSPKHGATAELAKGSCGSPNGLQTVNALGSLSARRQSWSLPESLTQLTASPLAVVIRSGGKIIACGQVRQG